MLNQILAITIKDLKVLVRDRGGMISLFLMPVMFILVMSFAQRDMYSVGTTDKPVELLVVNLDEGDLAEEVITNLAAIDGMDAVQEFEGKTLNYTLADKLIEDREYNVAIIFPENFSDQILAATSDPNSMEAVVKFIADPSTSTQFLAPIRGSVEGFIQSMISFAQLPDRLLNGFDQMAAESPAEQAGFITSVGNTFVENMATGDFVSDANLGVRFEQVAPSSYRVPQYPTSIEQNVPGYTIFGVFFIVQVLATSILSEKQDGTFRRLLVAPLARQALLLGKLVPYYIVNLIQVASMFTVGKLVFDMNLGQDPLALILLTISTAAAATGLGLLVATMGKTPEQIGGLSTMLALTLAALGGVMVPSFAMPEAMQNIAKVSPHYWALSGFQDVIVRGLSVQSILNETGILFAFGLIFFAFALWRFRFQD
ncbi:MAG: ABC transporter permease [Chloroflexi bacterium]|jgi:ABC-2 type transport system permease protein|nr:ABC transporter permease [Chloroflexota bacterium]MBT3670362.1 ABC transporter permease [Chloroflexota bacterium]MBT4001926.1 ABC transporter permease [Chloroflexota bacterium]MBT4305549.1 ABC transporter permease [Chloroflexota bacterium]MBT4533161.1 ABC transporter permease [Chloroflexota bacterium]